jgi:DEAD/DEAH box helicase domain-containing protein
VSKIEAAIAAWQDDEEALERIAHIEHVPGRGGFFADLDPPPPPVVVERLAAAGIDRLWRHQERGIRSVREGRHTVVVSTTASGKSLVYQVPIAEAIAMDRRTSALLIFPTKALAQDQFRSLHRVAPDELVAAIYDGDTETDDRRWARRNANVILTNPDMLHVGLLPYHARWEPFLSRLRYVVVDELHTLRGVFGSHVAHVLRRLRRVAAHYGASPTFVFTSATIGNPGELASALTALDVEVVQDDGAPVGEKRYVLWNPELEDPERGIRASPMTAATRVFGDLVSRDLHTIVFSRSRKASELIYRWARDRVPSEIADRIASYRGGYTAADRRRIEQALFSGELIGVTATNALELGIDVGGLDAAVITTFPGTIASFRQQAGRSGRDRSESLAVLVAGHDALDQYYITHPWDLFGRTPEAAVVNPANPTVMEGHVKCAAHELPLVPDDRELFGPELEEIVPDLVAANELGIRNGRLFYGGGGSPARSVDLRTSGRGGAYSIWTEQGDLLGTVDEDRAFTQCHEGAVYLHQGDTFVVAHLDTTQREIRVRPGSVDYYTQPKIDKDLGVTRTLERRIIGDIVAHHGTVEVTSHVLGYQKKAIRTAKILDTLPLDLPPRQFTTQAFWYVFPQWLVDAAGIAGIHLPGTLHAAEHTGIAMLPLFAICDRWDVGGLSIAHHPQLGEPVFFIYDGYPGGAGIAPIGFGAAERHLRATLATLDECPCRAGCPSCVQSPKCGNFNEPLDKAAAAQLLRTGLGPVAHT